MQHGESLPEANDHVLDVATVKERSHPPEANRGETHPFICTHLADACIGSNSPSTWYSCEGRIQQAVTYTHQYKKDGGNPGTAMALATV